MSYFTVPTGNSVKQGGKGAMSPVCANTCLQERPSLSRGVMDNNSEHPALPHLVPWHSGLGLPSLRTGLHSAWIIELP